MMNLSTANRVATLLVAAILLKVTVTAYHAPCRRCHTRRHTVTGAKAHGSGLAVDPRLIPIGSRVKVGGKWYIADDIGPHGHRVDIRLPNTGNVHKRMRAFGRKRMTIKVIPKRKPHGRRADRGDYGGNGPQTADYSLAAMG